MLKRILISTFALTLLTPITFHGTVEAQSQAAKEMKQLVMPWQFYRRLSKCETALNINHDTRSFTGMYGIAKGTWVRWSNSSSAKGKDPFYQARVVDNIAWLGHTKDGVFKWPVGPWGWGAIKQNCMGLQQYICRSPHKAVQRWKRNC